MRALTLILALLFADLAVAEDPNVSIFVFNEAGAPLTDVNVTLDGETRGRTDAAGALIFDAPQGEYRLQLWRSGSTFMDRDLLLEENEILQLLVTVLDDDRVVVDVESSNPDKKRQLADEEAEAAPSGPPGTLAGRIISAEDGSPVTNARVFVSGISTDLRTDAEGRFSLELPPGQYALSVLSAGFNTQTVDAVAIESGTTTEKDLTITPAGSELPEYVVVEPFISGSLASVLEERRTEAAVANILGAEQISKAGDSDAAGALKRVTGLTLVDGKFIYVRGLGERYSSTLLNGADVPSPDATRRVVPLDLFPTGIIESISVRKGYTAELPAEFGGGSVQIRTQRVPEEAFLTTEVSLGYNDQTTFKDGLRYDGGSDDWTGYDDGSRDVPEPIAEVVEDGRLIRVRNFVFPQGFEPEEIEAFGESFPVNYDLQSESIDPDLGLGISGGNRFNIGEDTALGFLAALDYGNSWETRFEEQAEVVRDGDGVREDDTLTLTRTERNIDLSAFLTLGAEFGENHSLALNTMLLRNTTDRAQREFQQSRDFDGTFVFSEIEWRERELQATQLLGEHLFPSLLGLKLDWQFTDAEASDDVPDFRRYLFEENDRVESGFVFSDRSFNYARTYAELADTSENYNVDLSLPISLGQKTDLAINAGISDVEKARSYSIQRYSFDEQGSAPLQVIGSDSLEDILNENNIGVGRGFFRLIQETLPSDSYDAELTTEARYISLDLNYDEWLRITAGVREEEFFERVATLDPFAAEPISVVAELDDSNRYPAGTATFYLPADNQLRFGYAETVNRPDFKELSEAVYEDPVLDRLVRGNPDLQIANIKHYDLRWDKYFSPAEFISLGVFYKEFEQPIELVQLPGAAGLIEPQNADMAENFGVEFEFYKDFSWLGERWENFYFSSNYAWIDSEISLGDAIGNQTNENRALQGQSPYVVNLQIGYDDTDRDIQSALLFNMFGERIVGVGILGAPDEFEQPFEQLDFVYSQGFGEHWKFKFKLKNILDSDVEFTQGDITTRRYTKGRELSLGLQWSF